MFKSVELAAATATGCRLCIVGRVEKHAKRRCLALRTFIITLVYKPSFINGLFFFVGITFIICSYSDAVLIRAVF